MESELFVKDAMTHKVITASQSETVANIAAKMISHDIGCVLVENKKIIGIVTERDILKVVSKHQNPSQVSVKEVMSAPVISIEPNTSLLEAAKLMTKYNLRRLPVLKGEALMGIVTSNDIVRIAPQETEILREIMRIKDADVAAAPKKLYQSGECEKCENFSEYLENVNGLLLCEDCKETEGEVEEA